MKPMVDAIATGMPMAADVATALCSLTLQRVMKGTARNAPPVPTMPATMPIPAPTPNIPGLPGNSPDATGGLRSMRHAPHQMKRRKRRHDAGGNALAICGPISDPTTMPGDMAFTTFQSTAPRA